MSKSAKNASTALRSLRGLRLVDSVGYMDDAVQAAGAAAGLVDARVVLYHRCNDRARTPYSITPNTPLQGEADPEVRINGSPSLCELRDPDTGQT